MLKKKTRTKLLLIMVFFLLSLSLNLSLNPKEAWAETGSLKATNFQVDVKPEYDDPRTLVIYQGDFTNTGTETIKIDTPISFIIPKGAEIGMACEINAQDGHDCQPYTTQDLDDNQVKLTWKITKDIAPNQKYPAYLEFYYDNGSKAPTKTFKYKFLPTYDLDNLTINLVAPKSASNIITTPVASTTGKDSEGLSQFSFNYKSKTPKDVVAVKVDYNKSDNKPTFDKPQTGSNSSNSSSSGSNSPLSKPEILIPSLLFVAIVIFIFIFGFNRNKEPLQGAHKGTVSKHKGLVPSKKPNQVVVTNGVRNQDVKQDINQEKRKLRQMLLDGKIGEDTYKQLLAELIEDE